MSYYGYQPQCRCCCCCCCCRSQPLRCYGCGAPVSLNQWHICSYYRPTITCANSLPECQSSTESAGTLSDEHSS